MKEYLADYDQLAQFIDALIAKKYPGQPKANYSDLRERSIEELDKEIGIEIFASLNEEQLKEVNALLDTAEDPSVFQDFFTRAGIDLKSKMTNVFEQYGKKFLGETNE